MKKFHSGQRLAVAACSVGLASLLSTGCTTASGLASLNPFAKSDKAVASVPAEPAKPNVAGRMAAMRQAATGQVNSLNMAASSAWTKTKGGVKRMMGGSAEATAAQAVAATSESDPTKLGSPGSVGPELFVTQGALLETAGDFAKAMESYQKALQAEPSNASALASVARLNMRQENFVGAADYFQKAIAASPNDAALHNDHGLALAKLGDLTSATQAISKAVALSPGKSRFANNLANVRYDAGDAEGALAVLTEYNKPAVAHFNMAYLHFRAGNYLAARAQLQEVVKYEPQAASDTAIAQAVSRSREMLTQIDGGAARVAQAGSGVLSTASTITNTLANQQIPGTATPAQTAVPTSSVQPYSGATPPPSMPTSTLPPFGGMPTTTGVSVGTMPAQQHATPGATSQPFALPPGAFDQPIR